MTDSKILIIIFQPHGISLHFFNENQEDHNKGEKFAIPGHPYFEKTYDYLRVPKTYGLFP